MFLYTLFAQSHSMFLIVIYTGDNFDADPFMQQVKIFKEGRGALRKRSRF